MCEIFFFLKESVFITIGRVLRPKIKHFLSHYQLLKGPTNYLQIALIISMQRRTNQLR